MEAPKTSNNQKPHENTAQLGSDLLDKDFEANGFIVIDHTFQHKGSSAEHKWGDYKFKLKCPPHPNLYLPDLSGQINKITNKSSANAKPSTDSTMEIEGEYNGTLAQNGFKFNHSSNEIKAHFDLGHWQIGDGPDDALIGTFQLNPYVKISLPRSYTNRHLALKKSFGYILSGTTQNMPFNACWQFDFTGEPAMHTSIGLNKWFGWSYEKHRFFYQFVGDITLQPNGVQDLTWGWKNDSVSLYATGQSRLSNYKDGKLIFGAGFNFSNELSVAGKGVYEMKKNRKNIEVGVSWDDHRKYCVKLKADLEKNWNLLIKKNLWQGYSIDGDINYSFKGNLDQLSDWAYGVKVNWKI